MIVVMPTKVTFNYLYIGFEKIGTLTNHIIQGADEYILRKQKCPVMDFNPTK